MPTLQTPFSYERLNPVPLDVSAVFDNLAAFQAYLASPTAYIGQIVAVRNATNEPDIYRINEDKTYSTFGGGGSGTLSGDVTGAAGSNTVARIRGRNVATTVPNNGEALAWNTANNQWQPTPGAGGTLAGDVTGATSATVVERLRGRTITTTTPTNGFVLMYNSGTNQWYPTWPGITALTADVTTTAAGSASATVVGLQRRPISTTAPANGQVLAYNSASGQWVPTQVSGGTITLAGDVTGVSSATVIANIRGRFVYNVAPAVNQAMMWNGVGWIPTTRTVQGDVNGNWNTTRVDRLRSRQISTDTPQNAQAYRWDADTSEWKPEDIGEPTYMLDAPPMPGQLRPGQMGCECKAQPIRLWIGVTKDVNNMESRLLIGPTPAPTIWDGGATTFDGGATTWDVFTP